MLPLGDSPKPRLKPWVNTTLILLNVGVFLYELSLGSNVDAFFARWAVVPSHVSAAIHGAPGSNATALVTLITAMFLHGGWLHLGGNMLFLWIFGDNVEDRVGHGWYLFFYFACGIAANLAQVFVDPSSTIPALGASGAIAGVLGAYVITYPGATVSVVVPIFFLFTVVDVPALIVIGLWFITQFFSGVASLTASSAQSGGVAWWAHVGGFLVGMALLILLPKKRNQSVDAWSVSLDRRARQDTGLVGVVIGTISTVSQLAQFVILLRVAVVFVGVRTVGQFVPMVGELIRVTNLLVVPFAAFIPSIRFDGRLLELYSVAALCAYYLLGAALIWIVARLAYRSPRRVARRPPIDVGRY